MPHNTTGAPVAQHPAFTAYFRCPDCRRINRFNKPTPAFVSSGDPAEDAAFLAGVNAGATKRFYLSLAPNIPFFIIRDGFNGNEVFRVRIHPSTNRIGKMVFETPEQNTQRLATQAAQLAAEYGLDLALDPELVSAVESLRGGIPVQIPQAVDLAECPHCGTLYARGTYHICASVASESSGGAGGGYGLR